ncbi:MAG: hypothetical protein H6502_00880 [Candidatus Woesearchaeota archaeon]|nr:MAG: hypothetical protein H6502_00880 [Candidatus Woesearchaeota archaeon]
MLRRLVVVLVKFLFFLFLLVLLLSCVKQLTNTILGTEPVLVQERSVFDSLDLVIRKLLAWFAMNEFALHTSRTPTATISVHFCPEAPCTQLFLDAFMGAREQILCSFYDFTHPALIALLARKQQEIAVTVLVEQENAHKISLSKDSLSALPSYHAGIDHVKYCVIDTDLVLVGSANPTRNGLELNNNNVFVIHDHFIAQVFTELFYSNNLLFHHKPFSNFPIIFYHCPYDSCSDLVRKALTSAPQVDAMQFVTSRNDLYASLLPTSNVRLLVEKRMAYLVPDDTRLLVRTDSNPQTMHHKVFIIGNQTLIAGSANPTRGGYETNNELLLISQDASLISAFQNEFDRLWAEGISRS